MYPFIDLFGDYCDTSYESMGNLFKLCVPFNDVVSTTLSYSASTNQ